MEVVFGVLADCANVSQEGKLNVMGVFDAIHGQGFPLIHPQMHVVVAMEASPAERGQTKSLEVKLLDADGRELGSVGACLAVPEDAPGQTLKFNQIFQINGVKFDRPGDYAFHILVNGEERRRIGFSVHRIPD
ncbi:MAG: hypothetical protein K6T75_11080 [Acetobacteraceae bacterium]|nr:hypothetical protein [Acetobacteraceae bacterium]